MRDRMRRFAMPGRWPPRGPDDLRRIAGGVSLPVPPGGPGVHGQTVTAAGGGDVAGA